MAQPTVKRLLLCKPHNFRVEYAINPWMKIGSGDPARALQQWESLVQTLQAIGVETEIADFPADASPEVTFARDQYIALDTASGPRIILANFQHAERQPEVPYYGRWFAEHGFTTETAQATFEGGNAILHGGKLYIGTGYRADETDCTVLANQFDTEVIPLPVTDNRFFHIDIALFTLDDNHAFYYPPAFTEAAQQILKRHIPSLHELTETEMQGYCANSLALGDHVIVQSGNPSFCHKLRQLGKTVHQVDVSEFKHSSGGIHCLTNTIGVS